ncbi:small VCP/p97-interacting protein-like [Symsagittifera roscoffensis]|uniref:small VCP/p97-interacting protein-like n=1 Tax=Symsagittifera roscoffensis TaxID=84072 RepID=UPI00307BBFD3
MIFLVACLTRNCWKAMGNCFGKSEKEETLEEKEERRRRTAEAASKRLKAEEGRGLADPEKVKRDRERREEIERAAEARQRQNERDEKIVQQWQS